MPLGGMGNVSPSTTPSPASLTLTPQQDKQLQDDIQNVILEEFPKLRKRDQNKLKISKAAPLEFNINERENFTIIEHCLRLINRSSSDFFEPKPNQGRRCTGRLSRGCTYEWESYDQRVIFFEECLKATDPNNLHRKMIVQSSRLEMMRRNMEAVARDFSAARVAGGSQLIGGGILMGLLSLIHI